MVPETEDSVLILGDPSDPIVLRWKDYCDAADVPVTLYFSSDEEDPEPDDEFTILLNTNVDIPFFHLQHLPDTVREALADDCLILNNCIAETPTSTAAEIHDEDCIVGYSGIGLYTGTPVVEICKAIHTKPIYLQKAHDFLSHIGIRTIEVPEVPGLILGRILAMLVNEATSALMEGVATAETIDRAMQLGTRYPQGPLTWADYVGLDVIVAILSHLQDEYGDERYNPMPLLRQKVDAGLVGRKSGEGFFSYHPESLVDKRG